MYLLDATSALSSTVVTVAITTFTLFRLVIWAFLVGVAWYEIIEKAQSTGQRTPRPKKNESNIKKASTPIQLTATALAQREQAAPRWPQHIPPMEGVSEMGDDESLDEWAIWDEPTGSSREAPRAIPDGGAVIPPAPQITDTHAPVDQDDAHVLASTTLGGNTDLIKEPVKEVIRRDPHTGKKHKEKKPFLTRKVEKWFVAPYTQKYERAGYMIYRGFNKIGRHVETSIDGLAEDLDGAIRDAGVQAVREVEAVAQKWIKFFGTVAILSIVLLPLPMTLPAIHVSMDTATF